MSRKALDVYYNLALSKHDLKASATFFLKICMRPWIRRLRFLIKACPREGDLATKLYTSDKENVEIEIVYTCDQTNVEIEHIYTSDKKCWNRNTLHFGSTNVEIEIVYTSDKKTSKPLTTTLLLFSGSIYIFCLLPTTIFLFVASCPRQYLTRKCPSKNWFTLH